MAAISTFRAEDMACLVVMYYVRISLLLDVYSVCECIQFIGGGNETRMEEGEISSSGLYRCSWS